MNGVDKMFLKKISQELNFQQLFYVQSWRKQTKHKKFENEKPRKKRREKDFGVFSPQN